MRQLKRLLAIRSCETRNESNPVTAPTGQLGGESEPESTKTRAFRAKTGALASISPRFSRSGGASKLAQEGGLWQISARLVGPSWRPILDPSTCCRSSVVEHSIGNGEVDSS